MMRGNTLLKTTICFVMTSLICMFFSVNTMAAEAFEATATCQNGQKIQIVIAVTNEDAVADGYDIFRLNPETEQYEYVDSLDLFENGMNEYRIYDGYDDTEYEIAFGYDVLFQHEVGKTYSYLIKSFSYNDEYKDFYCDFELTYEELLEFKEYTEESTATVVACDDAPEWVSGKRKGKLAAQLEWTKVENADGYMIYAIQDYTSKSKYKPVNPDNLKAYKLVKEIDSNSTTSVKFSKLMNGVTYTYRICSYRYIDDQKVVSLMSEPQSVLMDYYSYDGESYKKKIKRAFGSEKKKRKNFTTAAKANKQMKTIKIKVWDFKNGKKGKKITKTKYLTVNKRLAPSIKAMFNEIYKSKEKQVIKDISSYSYRYGEHMYGLAIDINPNENYMVDGGQVLAGGFWNPKKSKYSIPLNCETVRIMQRYGFYRGFWGDRKDYMHFSYFGT